MKKKSALLIFIAFLLLLSGCRAFVPHSKNDSLLVGSWTLDCIYVDTKPIKFTPHTISFNKDLKGGQIATVNIIKPAKYDVTGFNELEPAVTETVTEDFTLAELKDGSFTILRGDGATMYTYSIDEPAQLLHMYVTAEDGVETHYIYRDITAK